MLTLLKQALWLVVPFLFAIILYYVLFPAVRRLTLAGVDRETAAGIVAGGSLFVAAVAMVPTPACETSFTETSACGLTCLWSQISWARSSIE